MEEKKEECKHAWQCYGVPIIENIIYMSPQQPAILQTYIFKNSIKHFRTCKLCGKVESIEETK